MKKTSEVIEYANTKRWLIAMAAKAPSGKKRKRKMRLTLKQSKLSTGDKYQDSLGWSTDVGRTLTDQPEQKGPETMKVQCDQCGSMLKIRKPKKSRYTVECSFPECGNVMVFE